MKPYRSKFIENRNSGINTDSNYTDFTDEDIAEIIEQIKEGFLSGRMVSPSSIVKIWELNTQTLKGKKAQDAKEYFQRSLP